MARDHTARARIRQHLARHGPLEDGRGLATKVLRRAVGYEGSPVAFIQLLVAMERDGELVREVRGKRTYRITAAEPPVGQRRIPPELPQSTESTESTESMEPTAPPAGSAGHGEIDYPLLARHVLRELSDSGTLALIQELTAEQRRIAVERDDYARRLALARARLEELRDRSATTSTPGGTPPDAPDRRRRPPGDPLHHG